MNGGIGSANRYWQQNYPSRKTCIKRLLIRALACDAKSRVLRGKTVSDLAGRYRTMRCCFSPEDFPFLDRALEQVCNQLRDRTDTPCTRERIARAVLEQASGGERNLAVIVTSVVESITSPERAG